MPKHYAPIYLLFLSDAIQIPDIHPEVPTLIATQNAPHLDVCNKYHLA
jgi:hypothetical protein